MAQQIRRGVTTHDDHGTAVVLFDGHAHEGDGQSGVHLKAGDVVVQQGTNHASVNRGQHPCRIAFILIDAVA